MQTGVGAPCLLGREGSPSGEADKPLQLETVRVNDLPLINMCALALTSRGVCLEDVYYAMLRSA